MSRRLGHAVFDVRPVRTAVAGLERRQYLLVVLAVVLSGRPLGLARVQGGPAGVDDGDAARPERYLIGLRLDGRDVLQARRVKGGDETDDNGVVHLALLLVELAGHLAGRDEGVVVADFGVVDQAAAEVEAAGVERLDGLRLHLAKGREDPRNLRFHVAAQVTRIGPGIGDQLVLVQGLGGLQRRCRGQAVAAVHGALQVGEVVQQRGQGAFALGVDRGDRQWPLLRQCQGFLRLLLRGEAAAAGGRPGAGVLEADVAVPGEQFPKRFRCEVADLVVARRDQGQYRGLDTANAPQPRAVAHAEVAGRVETDNPVGFIAAAGGVEQPVVVAARPHPVEGVADRLVGK